jgi:peptide chain release factor 1
LIKEIVACKELCEEDDKEIKKLAEEDLEALQEQLDDLQVEIEDEVVPKRSVDSRDVTLEIRQAAGGSESSLFAEDLVTMYKAYC